MSLAPRTKLGPYEILAPLGAGGMGEVYRARDARLGRDVAIKMVLPEYASDPDRLRRFEQEARAAGALAHPNVLTVYDVGHHEGSPYLVTELLEGETLQTHMGKGALSLRSALEVGGQVAAGLAAAHERGITHRDLKPANIFITKEGIAKILDFGLAKLLRPTSEEEGRTDSTVAESTEADVRLGTAPYMSPEQASGKGVDFRSDQFSLGIVLYEMLAKTRPFKGDTAAELLAAIIREDPEPLERKAPSVPAPARWIVERCLAKEPSGRYAATRDLARDLETARMHLSEGTATTSQVRPRRTRWLGAAGGLGLALGLGSGWVIGHAGSKTAAPRFHRITYRHGSVHLARFTSDGQDIVYSAAWDGRPPEIFTARANGTLSRPLGVQKADLLAVSPKGEIAVSLLKDWPAVGKRTLAVLPMEGGTPREVAEDVDFADYDGEGQLAAVRHTGNDWRIEYPLGHPVYRGTSLLWGLTVAQRGGALAFGEFSGRRTLRILDRQGKVREIGPDWGQSLLNLRWAPDGNRLVVTGAHTHAEQTIFEEDVSTGRERVLLAPSMGRIVFHDVAPGGQLLVEHVQDEEQAAYLANGTPERNVSFLDHTRVAALSDDGRVLLFSELGWGGGPPGSVFLRRIDSNAPPVKLADGLANDLSGDARWALVGAREHPIRLSLVPTGVGEPRALDTSGLVKATSAFLAPDSMSALVVGAEAGKEWSLYEVGLSGTKPRLIASNISPDQSVAFSPDGRTVAATDSENRLALVPRAGGIPRVLPGVSPSTYPAGWASDGKSLFVFQHPDRLRFAIFTYGLATGSLTPWKTIVPADLSGVNETTNFKATPDFETFAFSYHRQVISDLYVVDGAR